MKQMENISQKTNGKTDEIEVYLVNHTHWDREWYFSHQDSLVLSDLLFTDIINELDKQPEVSFTLDGQLSILDDYLNLHPEKLTLIRKLVKENRLLIGPWFTQPDALHTQGESLLRNGMIGKLTSQKYGKTLNIGYLPDTFGFNSQLPIIISELGMESFIFWRGINPDQTKSLYFNWYNLSKSRHVIAVNMPQGYGTGMLLAPTKSYVNKKLDPAVEFIKQYLPANFSKVLIPTGNDQMSIIHDFSKKVTQINKIGKYHYYSSSFSQFINQISKYDLRKYSGELIEPIFARIHRTCGSSRMPLKLEIVRLENKLIYQVEPLLVMARTCEIDLSNNLLVEAWKKVLESQAHDSLAGSISDSVAEDIRHRIKEGNELADGIINTIQRLLALKLRLKPNQVLIFNPALKENDGYHKIKVFTSSRYVEFENAAETVLFNQTYVKARAHILLQSSDGDHYINEPGYFCSEYLVKKKLFPLSYQVLTFHEVHEVDKFLEKSNQSTKIVASKNLKLKFESGIVSLTIDNKSINDFIYFEDQGNAGDTYDYSPLINDEPLKLHFNQAKTTTTKNGIQQLKLFGETTLAADLNERQQNKKTGSLKYSVVITLDKNQHLGIVVKINNQIDDHYLRLVINTGILNQTAIGSVPYGFIKHKTENLKNWKTKYSEKPVNVWPLDNSVSLSSGQRAITIYTSDIKEYEQNGNYLKFTLLATTNQLGKPNLINRPGRASGDTTKVGHPLLATPQAEYHGKFEFNFDIQFSKQFMPQQIANQSYLLKSSALTYQMQNLNLFANRLDNKLQDDLVPHKKLPRELSLFNKEINLCVSACYPDYFDKSAVIIRLFNPTEKNILYKVPDNAEVVDACDQKKNYSGFVASYDLISLKFKK
ncbi:MAG: glycoside hydrolase family 38 C-terminal domain-containing protein [Liquorilactobacillus ghanensis]|uniref:glycoside hydrolase family 38 N-terminal domain-containing protein n=1 Tax=Liquorilactobacillus ghanensis TaxID=399370 RepID=UPI0039EC347B